MKKVLHKIIKTKDSENDKRYNRVGRTIASERLRSGIEELGLLMELLNFQVEIST
jgi:hypothetical protein